MSEGFIQPRPYMPQFHYRRKAYGLERRRNIRKYILEDASYFPKPIEYSDIDQAVLEWVDKTFRLEYNGKRIPTYKLFSTQRLSEYSETWENVDDTGSMVLNFKTVTRETNPQKGENQGNLPNIPGHRNYAMYLVPVLQENGDEAYDLYTMKQPFAVNFSYSIGIVTNKYELLNEMNSKMHYEFQAINAYIAPNGHYMPMTLEDIQDESEYGVEDRKYYSQIFKIKVKAYIIRREDFTVTRVPSKLTILTSDSMRNGSKGKNGQKGRKKQYDIQELRAFKTDEEIINQILINEACGIDSTNKFHDVNADNVEIIEEYDPFEKCKEEEEERYYYKTLKVVIKYDACDTETEFTIDTDMVIEDYDGTNISKVDLYVNNELISWDKMPLNIYNEDVIKVKIVPTEKKYTSELVLVGYDPNTKIDKKYDPESELDAISDETDIYIEKNDDIK